MDIWSVSHSVDLNTGQISLSSGQYLASAVQGNSNSLRWQVTVLNNGSAAALTGCTCAAKVVRSDGQTVAVAGSISGNVCTVTLSGLCFAVLGKVKCVLNIMDSTGDIVMSVSGLCFTVEQGDTGIVVDPGTAFPELSALINAALLTAVEVTDFVGCVNDGAGVFIVSFEGGGVYTLTCTGSDITIT